MIGRIIELLLLIAEFVRWVKAKEAIEPGRLKEALRKARETKDTSDLESFFR